VIGSKDGVETFLDGMRLKDSDASMNHGERFIGCFFGHEGETQPK